ncbi:MAG: hypothetical protein GX033_03900 [Firmicutes bacterium]|nr:hypothetical protein [Bacillota bacterium]
MIITFGGFWLPILLTLALVGYLWYWSTRKTHRALEKLDQQEQVKRRRPFHKRKIR